METTDKLWERLKDNHPKAPSWLVESLGTYLEEQLDAYAKDPVENQVTTLRTLQELAGYPNPIFQPVFLEAISLVKNHIEESPEKEEIEDIMRGNNIMNTSGRELSSDADFFHLLYQKGIVTDDGMQRHRTSQFYALVSTFSDLVDEERKGRAFGPTKTPPIPLQDWLAEWEYLEARNKELSHGDLSALSNKSDKELLHCLLFSTEKLSLAIYPNMYDDMCANAVISYTFLILAAGLVQRSKETTWNPHTAFKEAKRVLSYIQNTIERVGGENAFLVLGAMLLVIVYQRLLAPHQMMLPTKFASYLADTFDPNKLKINNQLIFSSEFKSLCARLEKECQVGLTEEDAIIFGIPQPFIFPWWRFLPNHPRPIALWEELKEEVCAKKSKEGVVETELPKTIMEAMDSLVNGFQVESGAPTDTGLTLYSAMELHQILCKHQNQMLRQVIQEDVEALWETIATNLVIAKEVQEQLLNMDSFGTSSERSLLGQDLFKMDYQNKKYIGIVEAAKPDASIQEYATLHKKRLLQSFLKKCNPA